MAGFRSMSGFRVGLRLYWRSLLEEVRTRVSLGSSLKSRLAILSHDCESLWLPCLL